MISGNTLFGLELSGSSGVTVVVNLIGTDASGIGAAANGAGPLPNGILYGAGIFVVGTPPARIRSAERRLPPATWISANAGSGVLIQDTGLTSELVQDNYIGTTTPSSVGTNLNTVSALGNAVDGVQVVQASGVSIIGNVIGANGRHGISALYPSNLAILANYVGVGPKGNTAPLGNQGDGIVIVGAVGTPSGISVTDNYIVNSGQNGVEVDGNVDGMILASNAIGGVPLNASSATPAESTGRRLDHRDAFREGYERPRRVQPD